MFFFIYNEILSISSYILNFSLFLLFLLSIILLPIIYFIFLSYLYFFVSSFLLSHFFLSEHHSHLPPYVSPLPIFVQAIDSLLMLLLLPQNPCSKMQISIWDNIIIPNLFFNLLIGMFSCALQSKCCEYSEFSYLSFLLSSRYASFLAVNK